MDPTTRRALLNEALGYWKMGDMTTEQGNGKSMEVLLDIAAVYGQCGLRGLQESMTNNLVPERYQAAIISALTE